MKIVFMGTPDFAVPTLKKLASKYEVVAVVSQPDRAKGRGKKLLPTPVKQASIELNIKNILQPENIKSNEVIETLKSFDADFFIVVAYGQILPKEILEIPKYSCINIHGSLLPKYRGAAPIQAAIINGDKTTGITIMYMNEGMDTGDMILKTEIPIEKDDTYGTLYEKMSYLGADTLIEALYLIQNDKIIPQKQEENLATYAPRIFKEMGKIDWNRNSNQIINLIKGLNPTPSTFSFYKDEIFKIHNAEETLDYNSYNCKTGEIIDIVKDKGVVVKTNDSAIIITELQAKGGKKMLTSDYLRGHSLEKGQFFN